MQSKKNYQLMLEKQLSVISGSNALPRLLLHACCAPCSSYVLEYLNPYFDITLFYYNPNISPDEEYYFRANELKRLTAEMPLVNPVNIIIPEYAPTSFEAIAKGKKNEQERGSRCTDCYSLRLEKTFSLAEEMDFDYFSTTLSISPYKDADRLNSIGCRLSETSKTEWLFSDFKKKNGYKRSIELSEKYGLYRQNYCGCIYSKQNKT